MGNVRGLNAIENARQSEKPVPELLPFLDALAELIAVQIMQELQLLPKQKNAALVPDHESRHSKTVDVRETNYPNEGQP